MRFLISREHVSPDIEQDLQEMSEGCTAVPAESLHGADILCPDVSVGFVIFTTSDGAAITAKVDAAQRHTARRVVPHVAIVLEPCFNSFKDVLFPLQVSGLWAVVLPATSVAEAVGCFLQQLPSAQVSFQARMQPLQSKLPSHRILDCVLPLCPLWGLPPEATGKVLTAGRYDLHQVGKMTREELLTILPPEGADKVFEFFTARSIERQ